MSGHLKPVHASHASAAIPTNLASDQRSYREPVKTAPAAADTVGAMRHVEHRPMRPPLERSRCRCARCGAHSAGVVGQATLGGRCSTCGSYELIPLGGGARVLTR